MASTTAAGGRRPSSTGRRPASGERFYSFVVFASVLLFILLAAGIGIMALQSSLR